MRNLFLDHCCGGFANALFNKTNRKKGARRTVVQFGTTFQEAKAAKINLSFLGNFEF